jgi:hypothetical protein
MKKTKLRTRSAGSKSSLSAKSSSDKSAPRKAMDLAEVRRQITHLVGNGAIGMVETTMEEVGKGHYLGMKYLFEMIGLYPATSTDDVPIEDSLAATLLRTLGIPEVPAPESRVTKDSRTTTAVSEDVLE